MSIYIKQVENIPEESIEIQKQRFRKFAKSFPPYNFVNIYAKILLENKENTPEGAFGKRFAVVLSLESDRDINSELKMIEIQKDLIPLIENTDNKIFYRPLFFPSIFINNDFIFEGLIIKGMYITECYAEPGTNNYTLYHPNQNDYVIFVVAADIKEGCEFYSNFALINRVIGENFTDTKEEHKRMRRLNEYVRLLICNIIDMVDGNDEDLEVTVIKSTREQNLKRIKRGQIATPDKVFIKPKGKFKKYVTEFVNNIDKIKLGHSFPVRGHWRHYRDERYVNVSGTKQWIKPFIKGEGILIRKDYEIIKK